MNLKEQARLLAEEKGGRMKEYDFLCKIEERGLACIRACRSTPRPIRANLDFYSGFIYEMIGIPRKLGEQEAGGADDAADGHQK